MSAVEKQKPPVPATLTAGQRTKILAWYAANPNGGYKSASRAAGLKQLTHAEAKTLIRADPEIMEQVWKGLGVDEQTAFKTIGDIMADPEHKDRLQAARLAINTIHGFAEYQRREINTEVDVSGTVQMQHSQRLTLEDLEARVANRLDEGGRRELPAAAAVLPASGVDQPPAS